MGLLRSWLHTSRQIRELDRQTLREFSAALRSQPHRTPLMDDESGAAFYISKKAWITLVYAISSEVAHDVHSDFNLGSDVSSLVCVTYAWSFWTVSKSETSHLISQGDDGVVEPAEEPLGARQALKSLMTELKVGTLTPTEGEIAVVTERLRRARPITIDEE